MDRDVAVYLRVSTDEQTTANQAPEVERLCATRGWRIVARYEETASGRGEGPAAAGEGTGPSENGPPSRAADR